MKWMIILLLWTAIVYGDNPLIPNIGMSDPHIRVYEGKLYLYSGHDEDPNDRDWIMRDWRIFSSTDLVNWDLESTITPVDTYMPDDSHDCWAVDTAHCNGKYYFYFSNRDRDIGVMVSDNPAGPFEDALGKPLINHHDPTILLDNDEQQTPYIVYGNKQHSYHIARLNEDMISLSEKPRKIEIQGEQWQKAPQWMDKNFIFKRNGIYYLSWGKDYATSTNVYGPYTCKGSVGEGYNLGPFAHGSFFEWKGQFYHVWCYYLKKGFKYRECIMTYCHFGPNGEIIDDVDFLNQHYTNGVGKYDASWDKIQAEWYYEKSKDIKKRQMPQGGFQVTYGSPGSWLKYANVRFGQVYNTFTANYSSSQRGGRIEIRRGSHTGPLLGTLQMESVETANKHCTSVCSISEIKGKYDIVLVFTGAENNSFDLDWFAFSNQ